MKGEHEIYMQIYRVIFLDSIVSIIIVLPIFLVLVDVKKQAIYVRSGTPVSFLCTCHNKMLFTQPSFMVDLRYVCGMDELFPTVHVVAGMVRYSYRSLSI